MRLTGILVVLGVLLCAPAAAWADITAVTVNLTPSTTAAGAHPDVTVDEKFTYSGGDSVKDTTLHFPPGLIGNPQATPLCPQASFQSDQCAAATQVGTTTVTATVGGLLQVPSPGKIYNLEPSGNEPALLGIVVTPLGGLGGKIFLTSAISLRTATDFGIDSVVRNMPNTTLLSGDTVINEVSLTLNGLAGGQPFMTNPTSCKVATTSVDADSYASQTPVSGSNAFTPTDCDKLPFKPEITASMGAPGATATATHVPFTATISQGSGESAQASAAVTLPAGLGPSINGATALCPPAQFAVDACPAGSRVGTAKIATPLLADPVSGPVYELQGSGGLPGVGVAFGGKLPFKLTGKVAIAGGRLQNVFAGLPDVPLSTFTLAIDGGPHGLLQAAQDLCSGPARTVNGAFTGQSGATAAPSAPVTVVGCPPTATASGRSFRGKRPRLSVTVFSARGGALLRSVSIKLPSNVRVVKSSRGIAVRSATVLPRSSWQLSKKVLSLSLARSGSSRVAVTLSGGSIRAGSKLARTFKRHRSASLRLTVTAVDTSGRSTVIPLRFSAKR
jgi:hypothetical protein